MDTASCISTIITKENNFLLPIFFSGYWSPFKGFHSYRKEFAPMGANSFPLRVGPHLEGRQKMAELLLLKGYHSP